MKRVFIALQLSDKFKDFLHQWQQEPLQLPVRFIAPKNLHITIVPPWETNNTEVIIEKLKQIDIPKAPITINFGTISYGPNAKNPRLIWLTGSTPQPLLQLRKSIANILHQPITDHFLTHITLARLRPNSARQLLPNIFETIEWQEQIEHAALLQSHLLSNGADYSTIQGFSLLS